VLLKHTGVELEINSVLNCITIVLGVLFFVALLYIAMRDYE
jgi:preprotein translocase subunit SecG